MVAEIVGNRKSPLPFNYLAESDWKKCFAMLVFGEERLFTEFGVLPVLKTTAFSHHFLDDYYSLAPIDPLMGDTYYFLSFSVSLTQ